MKRLIPKYTPEQELEIRARIKSMGPSPTPIIGKPKTTIMRFVYDNLDYQKGDNLFFLTIRFNKQQHTIEQCKQRLRQYLGVVLRELQGRMWFENPYKSVSVVEHGTVHVYHTHTIINLKDKTKKDLEKALTDTFSRPGNPFYLSWDFDIHHLYKKKFRKNKNYMPNKTHLLIIPVYGLFGVMRYISKEYEKLHHLIIKKWDFENLIPSEILFKSI